MHCATDAETALDLVRRLQPDLALVDVFLDRTDERSGLAAITSLRRIAPDLVIGAISGAMSPDIRGQCLAAGADWTLQKPIRRAQLLEAFCSGRRVTPTMLRTDLPLETIKQLYIERVMAEQNGNKSAAARILGQRRTTLQRMIARRKRT